MNYRMLRFFWWEYEQGAIFVMTVYYIVSMGKGVLISNTHGYSEHINQSGEDSPH